MRAPGGGLTMLAEDEAKFSQAASDCLDLVASCAGHAGTAVAGISAGQVRRRGVFHAAPSFQRLADGKEAPKQ
jgi:hypothetical protein